MKIILVDDEKKFINMLAKRLSLRGLNADVAYSGEEAVEKAAHTPYDLAVLDLKMPGISGFALKQKLLEMQPEIKLIFVTGHGAIDKNGDHSDDIFLAKPLNIDTLIETIHQTIHPDKQ
ncbi:MAG: response regulator [Desulfotignum sp.]|nr:response regulator [Desulfotignum sp.]MCF8113487.1 response regulator [Desulfotignum sp.]MCF8126343.1 response regulator [Desulfotignum sp.]